MLTKSRNALHSEPAPSAGKAEPVESVSYTHLDVYKRQLLALWTFLGLELALLAATVRWGIRKTARWALILICLGSPAAVPDCLGIPLSSLFAEYHAQMVLFIGMPVQLFNLSLIHI